MMQFILTGFKQESGFRVFTFERVEADRSRTPCTVRADLALIRRFGIQIQDLPLLCRSLLERQAEGVELQPLIYGEDEMRIYSTERSSARALAASRRKPPRRPTGETPGAAWRGQHT